MKALQAHSPRELQHCPSCHGFQRELLGVRALNKAGMGAWGAPFCLLCPPPHISLSPKLPFAGEIQLCASLNIYNPVLASRHSHKANNNELHSK